MQDQTIAAIQASLSEGRAIPYLGPGVLTLTQGAGVPAAPEALVTKLTVNASVPHKLRKNLTAAAQFMENFKHRKSVVRAMTAAFRSEVAPTELHRYLAALPNLPLVVNAWYDDLPQKACASRADWGIVQGVSQAEHFGHWVHYFREDGSRVPEHGAPLGTPAEAGAWSTLLYQPFGSVAPAENYLVSDSDFVEVLTEIDIQTPIPARVQEIRTGRSFLFLGCRFSTQMERMFARQIMKRSSSRHWAVLPETPTKNEARFLAEQKIERLPLTLADFLAALIQTSGAANPGSACSLGGPSQSLAAVVHS